MKYLVTADEGPGFASPEEAAQMLEKIVLPSFQELMRLEAEKKIVAGGLPLGGRAFAFIVQASSHDEVDRMLRNVPLWGMLKWKVTPLQTIAGRAEMEREILHDLKVAMGR